MEGLVIGSGTGSWRGRRVFVTGHTGFKGGWLAWMLARHGAQLTGYALAAPDGASLHAVARVASAFEREHVADVRDAAALAAALREAQPELVFHLAAQPLVRASYAQPVETFATNVMGTVHLLEAVRHCASVRAVVVVTSDKCYRDLHTRCHETDALGGHDPYSASKAATEIVTASYAQAFELPQRDVGVATVRAGNVIGGGDWNDDRLVPDLLRAIDAGQAPRLRNPHAVRPWQHVMDPLAGYVTLAEKLLQDARAFSGAWNFGPDEGDELPVRGLADMLRERVLSSGDAALQPVVDAVPDAAHEAPMLRLDSGKARLLLGWRPRCRLGDALALTWHWHRAWRRGADMRHATLRQIDTHASLAEVQA